MKILFEQSISEDIEGILAIESIDNTLNITVSVECFTNQKTSKSASTFLDKKQLHELIGALLHVQQKMK